MSSAVAGGGGGVSGGVSSVPLPCDVVPLVPTSVSSLLTALRNTQTYDYMRAAANADLTKYLLTCARNGQTNRHIRRAVQPLHIAATSQLHCSCHELTRLVLAAAAVPQTLLRH